MAYKAPPKRSDQEWKAFHAWRANPVQAVKDWFGVTPDPWQADTLMGLFTSDKDRVVAKAAHGVGKSALDAWAGWIFLNCYEDSRVALTAPTAAQLRDVLVPEFAKWQTKMPERMKAEWELSQDHIRHKGSPKVWFAVSRTSNRPENLQGFHNNNLLIIGDEGSAIPDNVFEVIEGALSEAGDEGKTAKLLLNGNPNFTAGELWNAFNRNKDLYHRVTITGDPEFCPSMDHLGDGTNTAEHGNLYYSPRVKPRYVKTMEDKYGRDSAVFDVRVKGIFPRAADDAVIPFEWAQRASQMAMPCGPFDPIAHPWTLVVDVSRGGGAETVIGWQRQGVVLKFSAHKTTTTTQIVNLVQDARATALKEGTIVANVVIDEPGIGGGVIDQLRALNCPVTPYHGGKALVKDQDPEEDIRMFANRKSRDWWNLRRLFEQNRMPIPDDEMLVNQLASVKFRYNQSEKIIVESKEDLKNRLGKEASPDRADVIVMACAPAFHPAAVHSRITEKDWYAGDDRPQMEMDL